MGGAPRGRPGNHMKGVIVMIGFILDLIGACGHFMWDVLCAVLDMGFSLLSAAASLLAWPFRAFHGLMQGVFHWTPLFIGFCLLLGVLLAGVMLLAFIGRARGRFK